MIKLHYLAIAAAIALVAFALGQALEGLGVIFVIVATTAWVMVANRRERGRSS